MIELKGRRDKMSTTKVTAEELTERFRHASGHDTMPDDWTPAGAWIRVSGDKQDETNQVNGITKYAIQHRYWIARWYIVHAKSAFKGEHQKDLDIAVADMREGLTEVLVIAHSNRLERREGEIGTELLNTLAEFVDAGGRVESVEEPTLGQLDMGSRITTYVTGLINTEKSKTIRRETRRAYDTIDANHGVRNKVPALWYTIEGDELDKHPTPTQLCRDYWPKVLARCIAGDSTYMIAGWLDSEGVRTQRGGKWNQGTILHLIHNPIFCGRRLGWEDAPLLKDEAVVPVDIWKLANEALANRPKRGPVAETNKPMLAKLRCLRCGSPMYRKMIGGRISRRYVYRCEGRGPQRKGCGNLVEYERLEMRVVVNMLTRNDKPYQTKTWVPGTNWDAEIADALQSLQALNPVKLGLDEYNRRHAELMTQLADYQWKNENEATAGDWEYIDVLNDDESVMTEGQHFFGLDRDGRREELKKHDIRAERTDGDIRLVFDDEEVTPNPYETLILNMVGPEVTAIMLESQIPNAIELQAILRGEMIPGAEETMRSYLTRRNA
jgi:Resolvase, N terminal domain/Recombinase/Recombinase zinc beta ribbon domain